MEIKTIELFEIGQKLSCPYYGELIFDFNKILLIFVYDGFEDQFYKVDEDIMKEYNKALEADEENMDFDFSTFVEQLSFSNNEGSIALDVYEKCSYAGGTIMFGFKLPNATYTKRGALINSKSTKHKLITLFFF